MIFSCFLNVIVAIYKPHSDPKLQKLDTECYLGLFFSDTTLRGNPTCFASMMQFHHVRKSVKQRGVPDSCFNNDSITSQSTKIHPNTTKSSLSITPPL